MKRSNPNLNKPSTSKLDSKLSAYKCDTKSKKSYTTQCQRCGHQFEFFAKNLQDKIIKCPECGYEEIFFYCNYDY